MGPALMDLTVSSIKSQRKSSFQVRGGKYLDRASLKGPKG